MTNTIPIGASLVAGLLALGGCGAATHSAEYRHAHETLQEARGGAAAELAPEELHRAELTMQRAEMAEDGSARERDLSYVADRQARIAAVIASRRALERRQELAERDYRRALETANQARAEALDTLDRELDRTGDELDDVRGELAERENVLDARTRELQAREEELLERQRQLEQEREARAAAEHEAQVALEQLAEVRQEQQNMVITLGGGVLFESGRADLLPAAAERLEAVARVLQTHPGRQIVIEGHTDSRGSESMNEDLSYRRAERVRQFLIRNGVPAENIRAVGRGEFEPIATNRTAAGRASNRRVEIVVEEAQAK